MTLTPGKLILANRYFANYETRIYVTAVENADNQELEPLVISAYDNFITGCKSDGIWDDIKASCILAGARTLNGALVPLVGTPPTNIGPFVNSDYNRKTGLKTNSSNTKYLDSNRPNNADGKDDHHLSIYCTEKPIGSFPNVIGNGSGQTFLFLNVSADRWGFFSKSQGQSISATSGSAGFVGGTRTNSSQATIRAGNISTTGNLASNTTNGNSTENHTVFKTIGGVTAPNVRLAFYSIGEALDLAKLDTRVSTLISDLGAAIP